MLNVIYYSLYDSLWLDAVHAGIVAAQTRLAAVDAARSAGQVERHDVAFVLVPAHEAGKWVGGSPNTNHGRSCERCQVHV